MRCEGQQLLKERERGEEESHAPWLGSERGVFSSREQQGGGGERMRGFTERVRTHIKAFDQHPKSEKRKKKKKT